ncbi:MAG: CNNM domain-containing protein [Metamycoplasmataceae bacterium]
MNTTILILLFLGLFILFVLSALFSAAETAYTSLSPATIEVNKKKHPKTGKLIKKHVNSYSLTIATILIGNNIANVAISSLITFLFSSALGSNNYLSVILPIFVATPLLVIFGEVIPKILAKRFAWGYLQKVVFVLEVFRWILFPITFFLSKLAFEAEVTNTEDEMKTILKMGYKEGVLEHKELSLATRALDLDSTKIKKHYVKIEDITFLSKKATIQEAKDLFQKTGFSRLPIKTKNNFVGVLLLKDIFNLPSNSFISDYIIEVPTVTINNNLHYALDVFRSSAVGMAFVKKSNNESTIIGLITLEDVIEELVGEIYDEHDKEEKITKIERHKFIIIGDTLMTEISEKTKIEFASNEKLIDWIIEETGKNIKTGLTYNWEGKVIFKVIKNKKKQVPKFEVIIK